MPDPRIAPALPAASVLVVRDGPAGLEILLQERHPRTRFAGGATVFPGGKVDAADASPEARARTCGPDGLDDAAAALRVAAIRELFEECGLLLARPRGEGELLAAERTAALARAHRRALEAGELALAELAAREDLELAADLLVPFAHWITPEPLPRRYDTHFFLVENPPDQEALHEPGESERLLWTTPAAALAEAERGLRALMFPTRMNLAKLGASASVAEAFAAARRARVVTVLPRVEATEDGPRLRIPAEAGYAIVDAPLDQVKSRAD